MRRTRRTSSDRLAKAESQAFDEARKCYQRGQPTTGRTATTPPRAPADDSLRDHAPEVTEDEKLFQFPSADAGDFTHTDTWRVLRIMGEFIEGFDTLAGIDQAVTIFGSARTLPDEPQYAAAEEMAYRLARRRFAIITGGGPGIMEAGNRGARRGGGRSINARTRTSIRSSPSGTSSCAARCSSNTRRPSSSSRAASAPSTRCSRR
jgi:hypothetical protein